jgi:hypothetical protein
MGTSRVGGHRQGSAAAAAGVLLCVVLAAAAICLTHMWNRPEPLELGGYSLYGPSAGRWTSASGRIRPSMVRFGGFELLAKRVLFRQLSSGGPGGIRVRVIPR